MRCIAFLLLSLLISATFAYAGPVYDYDEAISTSAADVLKGLKDTKKLENKRIAVLGFRDVEINNNNCTALSSSIANKIVTGIHYMKHMIDTPFTIVSRGQLDSIEAEYLMKAGDKDFFDSLEESDILITGDWQKAEDSFELTIKVLDVEGKSIELDSLSYTINKTGMPKAFLDCLKLKTSKGAGYVQKALNFDDLSVEVIDGLKEGSVLALQPVNRKEANITVGVATSLGNKIANSLQRAAFAKGLSFTYRAKLRGIWEKQDYLERLKSAGVDILISVTAYQAGTDKVEASLQATGLRGEQAGKVVGISRSIVTDIPQSYKARVKGVFAVADGSRMEVFESALRAGISSFKEISITGSDERDFEVSANVVYEIRVEETKESRDKAKSDKFLGILGGLLGTEENPNPLKGLFGSGTNIESLKAKIIQASVTAELKDLMNESVFEAEYNDSVKLPGDTSGSRMNQEAQALIKNMLKMVGKNLASRVLGKEGTGELRDNQMLKSQLEKERLKKIEERRLEVLEEQQYDEDDGFD